MSGDQNQQRSRRQFIALCCFFSPGQHGGISDEWHCGQNDIEQHMVAPADLLETRGQSIGGAGGAVTRRASIAITIDAPQSPWTSAVAPRSSESASLEAWDMPPWVTNWSATRATISQCSSI